MSVARAFCHLFLCLMMLGPTTFAQDKPEPPRLSVPLLAQAPVIDGVIDPTEWQGAAKITGFMGATGQWGAKMAPMESHIYLGHDARRFYMAVYCQLPPGVKPSMRYRRRDDPVYLDNYQLELWLSPPVRDRLVAYQMIGNAYGAIYDNRQIPDLGSVNVGWNGRWEFKNTYRTGEYWMAELAIDFAEFGVDSIDPEQIWRGLVAVAWPQRSWPYSHGFYKNVDSHALLTMADHGNAVRVNDLSSLFDNRMAPKLALINAADQEQTFTIRASVEDARHVEEVRVPAGQTVEHTFTLELPPYPEKTRNRMARLHVEDGAGRALLSGQWLYAPADLRERTAEQKPVEPWKMSTRMQFAPLAMGIRAWADVLDYPRRQALRSARFIVRGQDGSTVLDHAVNQFHYDSAEAYLWLPKDLPHGEYQLLVQFLGENDAVLDEASHTFKHENLKQRFIWLDNERGKNITVAPPFEPVRASDNTLAVWGRQIQMDGALPSQVISQGAAMLARPINLVAIVDGQRIEAKVLESFRLNASADTHATFQGAYELAGLRMDLTGELAFDGMMLYRLKATPLNSHTGQAVERLFISMSVKAEHARYYFSTGGGWNPAVGLTDAPPDGSSLVWESTDFGDFVPYVGLTDDHRAIQWFADEDHDWVLGGDAPCAQVMREGDVVEVQINLVRRRGPAPGFAARFGFIASPVRPLRDGWRHTTLDARPIAGSKTTFFYGPGHGGTPIDLHDTKRLAQALGVEVGDRNPDEVLAELPPGMVDLKSRSREQLRAAVPKERHGGLDTLLRWYESNDPRRTIPCYFYNSKMYFEGNRSLAFRTFHPGEWALDPPSTWFHLTPIESYQDFFAFYLDLWFKHWIVPGLYFDEVYFAPDRNVFNGNGRLMPDGSVRSSFALMHQRNYHLRMRQLFIDNNREPFIWVHTTAYMAPHAISAADIAMFGEDATPTPNNDIMNVVSPILLRSIGRAQKFGFTPVWMTMIGRGGSPWHLAGRQTLGWYWMHDVVPEYHTTQRDRHMIALRAGWGIDRDDVRFIPYWDNKAVQTSDEKFIASAWTRPGGRVLLMVMNMNTPLDGTTETTVKIDPGALGITGDYTIYDIESSPTSRKFLEAMEQVDAAFAEHHNPPEVRELSRGWENMDQRVTYDVRELQSVGRNKQFQLVVPFRNYRALVIEPR